MSKTTSPPWLIGGGLALALAGVIVFAMSMMTGSGTRDGAAPVQEPQDVVVTPTPSPTPEPAPANNVEKSKRLAPRLLKVVTPYFEAGEVSSVNLTMQAFNAQTGCRSAAEAFTQEDTALTWGEQANANGSVVAWAWVKAGPDLHGIVPGKHWSRAVEPIDRALLMVAVQCLGA